MRGQNSKFVKLYRVFRLYLKMSIDRLTSFGNEEDEIAGNGKKKKNAKPKSAYEEGVEG